MAVAVAAEELAVLELFHPKIKDGQLARAITKNSFYGAVIRKKDDHLLNIRTGKLLYLSKELLLTQFVLIDSKQTIGRGK